METNKEKLLFFCKIFYLTLSLPLIILALATNFFIGLLFLILTLLLIPKIGPRLLKLPGLSIFANKPLLTYGASFGLIVLTFSLMEAPTEESYVKRAEVSLEEFIKCDNEGGSYYRNECQGKLAVFYAMVWNHYEDTGVRLGLQDSCDSQRLYKTVDVPNLDYEYSKQHNEKCVRVYAKIGPENFNTPDLKVIETIWIESDEEFSERKEAKRLAEAKAEEEKQKALEEEAKAVALALEANKNNAEWLANKFDAASSVYCKSAVESLAKYDYEWTDGWLESKFPGYLTVTPSPYVFTSTGDKIKFQNGFGAWQNQKYYCNYNVKTKQVVRAWVQ